jgi:putative acyl-CoA dehydrogenase
VLAASLLLRHSPAPAAEAYCGSRLGETGAAFGTLSREIDCAAILALHA